MSERMPPRPTTIVTAANKPPLVEEGGGTAAAATPPQCTICLVGIDDSDVTFTPCDHLFHQTCIMQWLLLQSGKKEEPSCPLCRASCSALVTDSKKKKKVKRKERTTERGVDIVNSNDSFSDDEDVDDYDHRRLARDDYDYTDGFVVPDDISDDDTPRSSSRRSSSATTTLRVTRQSRIPANTERGRVYRSTTTTATATTIGRTPWQRRQILKKRKALEKACLETKHAAEEALERAQRATDALLSFLQENP